MNPTFDDLLIVVRAAHRALDFENMESYRSNIESAHRIANYLAKRPFSVDQRETINYWKTE